MLEGSSFKTSTAEVLEPGAMMAFVWPRWVRTGIPRDGSCFFHAISFALTGDTTGGVKLRKKLAQALETKTFSTLRVDTGLVSNDPVYRRGPSAYDDYMAYLDSPSTSVGAEVFDWVTRNLNIDIYIVRADGEYVYTPVPTYRLRKSIVLMHNAGHYECLGRVSKGYLKTRFSPRRKRIQGLYLEQIKAAQMYRHLLIS
jgi:hypothetical protein